MSNEGQVVQKFRVHTNRRTDTTELITFIANAAGKYTFKVTIHA